VRKVTALEPYTFPAVEARKFRDTRSGVAGISSRRASTTIGSIRPRSFWIGVKRPTSNWGIFETLHQAEAIVAEAMQTASRWRGFLDDPRWAWHAADMLGADVEYPRQYRRARPDQWPGAALARPNRALEWRGAGLSAAFVERPGQVARGGEQSRRPSQFNASDGGGMRTVGRDRQ
jgi:hypothetical protein